jgi:hypothetical protein
MSTGQEKKRFCTYCGNSVGVHAVFCGECGENIGVKEQAPVKPAASESAAKKVEAKKEPTVVRSTEKKQVNTQHIINVGTKAASVAQSLQAAQWQVVVGDQLPQNPFPELVKAAGAVGTKLSGSLGGPAFSLFIATIIEAYSALHTTEPAAMQGLHLKVVLSTLILIFGMVAKDRKGCTSKLVILTTLALSLIQANTLLGGLWILLNHSSIFASYLPNGITQAIALITSISVLRRSVK